ncbi:MAG: acyltransferase [Peptococcia bacterium]
MVIFRFDEVKEMRKLEEIEILRAIACLAVVMIHITAFVIFSGNVGKIPALVLSFINAFSVFAVPAFLVVSSYTLTYQYQDRKLELGRFYQKRFSRVVVPYIVWTCIYYGIFLILNTAQLSFPLLLKNLVFGDMVYHLYFVVLILQFYLLFFAFRYLWSRFNKLVMPLVYLVVNILFMRYANFMYIDRVFLRYIFFFALGGYMAYHREAVLNFLNQRKIRRLLIIGYLLLGAWAGIRYYQKFVLQMSYDTFSENMYWLFYCTVALLCYWSISQYLALRTPATVKRVFIRVSDASYYIYLAHPLALYLAQIILGRIPGASPGFKLILTLALVLGGVFPLSIFYQEHKGYFKKKLLSILGF